MVLCRGWISRALQGSGKLFTWFSCRQAGIWNWNGNGEYQLVRTRTNTSKAACQCWWGSVWLLLLNVSLLASAACYPVTTTSLVTIPFPSFYSISMIIHPSDYYLLSRSTFHPQPWLHCTALTAHVRHTHVGKCRWPGMALSRLREMIQLILRLNGCLGLGGRKVCATPSKRLAGWQSNRDAFADPVRCALLLALPILKLSQPLPNPASSFLYNFLFHLCSRQSIRLNRHHCSVLGVKVSQSVTVNQSPHSLRVFIDYFGSSICLSFCLFFSLFPFYSLLFFFLSLSFTHTLSSWVVRQHTPPSAGPTRKALLQARIVFILRHPNMWVSLSLALSFSHFPIHGIFPQSSSH